MNSEETPSKPTDNQDQLKHRRVVLIKSFTILVIIFAILYGIYWWLVASYYETTDDAYVNGNVLPVTSQINGMITRVNVDNTQFVLSGEPLIELEPIDYEVAFNQAKETLAYTIRTTLQMYLNNDGLEANIIDRQVALSRAKQDLVRRNNAVSSGAVSREELTHADDSLKSAEASLTQAISALYANLALTLNTQLKLHPSVLIAAAKMRQSYIDLQRTKIRAPSDGIIAKKNAQIGQQIAAGSPLMAVVPLDQMWVDANFKESQLRDIRLGQPVTLIADMYGSSVKYNGKVIGLSAGTGSAFALLPPQNATGNWIKVVQRLPVRIALDKNELKEHPLRIGLSITATVNTHDRTGPLIPNQTVKTTYETSVFDSISHEADKVVLETIKDNIQLLGQLQAISNPNKHLQQLIKKRA